MTNICYDRRSKEEMVYDLRRLGEKLIKEAEDIVGCDPDLGHITIEIEIDRHPKVTTSMSIHRESYIF